MSESYWDFIKEVGDGKFVADSTKQPPLPPILESAKMYTRFPAHVEPLPKTKEEIEEVMGKMFQTYNEAKFHELDY